MKKSWKNLSDRFLFRDRGILPARGLLISFFVFSIGIIILFSMLGVAWTNVFIIDSIFLFASLLDLLWSPKRSELTYKREMPEEMERGRTYTTEITVENTSNRPMHIRIKDEVPQTFHTTLPLRGWTDARGRKRFSYDLTAPVRGKYHMEKMHIRYRSKLGLWEKQTVSRINDTVKIIPDLRETKRYLEDAQRFLLHEGVKIRKDQGGEGEFAQIRKYALGDDPRKINWRQTAKLQEVMTNEYEPEHGKYITILIDCGRMMGAELEKGNRLDRTLEAALTTAAAALENGDYVGVLAFAKEVKVYIPPDKGMNHLHVILQSIYALEAEPFEANYPFVITYLQSVQKKRSLILLFSDIDTFLHEEGALYYLLRLRRRHLFFVIGIEDNELAKSARQKPRDVQEAMIKSNAQEQMTNKKREKVKWEARGLLLAEASGTELAATAVSHYIRVMNQGLL